jgi:hypothetical protein
MKITIEAANIKEAKELINSLGADVTIQMKKQYHTETFAMKQKQIAEQKGMSQEARNKISEGMKKAHAKKPDWLSEGEERTPHKFKRSHHKKSHTRQEATRRVWTKDEYAKLKQFYSEPSNHYSSGEVIGMKLNPFAESLNRTPMAVSLKVIVAGLNKKMVRGFIPRPANNLKQNRKEFPERVPKVMPPHKKSAYDKTKGYVASRWSAKDKKIVKEYYFDPANHYSNGILIHDKLEKFAKMVHRSKNAIQMQFIIHGYNKKLVCGSKLHSIGLGGRPQAVVLVDPVAVHEQAMLRRKPVVPATAIPGIIKPAVQFPEFTSVKVGKKVLSALFYQLAASKKSLKFKDASSYGIENYGQWTEFVYEALRYSKRIAEFLQVKGSFTLEKEGSDIYISYAG